MAQKDFAEAIQERREAIELIVSLIAQEGRREASLRDLRVLLIDVMGSLKRDPGIESAADDLYAAAAALVKDSGYGQQPAARKLRLLRDARDRFCGRLPAVSERGVAEEKQLKGLEAAYAVQLERLSAEDGEEAARDAA